MLLYIIIQNAGFIIQNTVSLCTNAVLRGYAVKHAKLCGASDADQGVAETAAGAAPRQLLGRDAWRGTRQRGPAVTAQGHGATLPPNTQTDPISYLLK